MGIDRTFRDINGIEWRVTHVSPVPPATVADEGWLSFQAGHLERHLRPVPTNWQTATVQRLEQMCRVAGVVQRTSESVAEPTVDTTPAEGAEAVIDETAVTDHMSLLANAYPVRESRITFRG